MKLSNKARGNLGLVVLIALLVVSYWLIGPIACLIFTSFSAGSLYALGLLYYIVRREQKNVIVIDFTSEYNRPKGPTAVAEDSE